MCDWLTRDGPMAHKADGWQLASDMNCSDDSSVMTTRWVTAHVPVSVMMITLHPFPSDGAENSGTKEGGADRRVGRGLPYPPNARRAPRERRAGKTKKQKMSKTKRT